MNIPQKSIEEMEFKGFQLGYQLTKVDQDRIIRILLKIPLSEPFKKGIKEAVLRWKIETDILAEHSLEISKDVQRKMKQQENTRMTKQEEKEYLLRFNEGYQMMKRGEEKLLNMLVGMTTPDTVFHQALREAKTEYHFEQQLMREAQPEYDRRKKELNKAMNQTHEKEQER